MKTKIAAFGREEIIDRLHTCITGQAGIEVVPFIYTDAKETVALIEKAFMCDIYLFTETLSFLYVKQTIEKRRLPAVQIACDDYMVLTSLFNAKKDQALNRLSIDVWNKHHVSGLLTELTQKNHEVYVHDYEADDGVNIDQAVTFHLKLWEEGKIDYALTPIKEVEQQLKRNNIPATCMEIPTMNIENAIKRAKSVATFNDNNNVQIVAGYIAIKRTDSSTVKEGVLGQLYPVLQQFTQQTHASIVTTNDNQFILFGTSKLLNYLTNHYRDFPLLQKIKDTIQVPVAIGFGLGLTTKQAESNAKLALDRCVQNENSNCYIVNERQDTIGPLGVKKHFDPAQLYQALIHKARLNNDLSYNFIDFIKERNNEPFSSNDIAIYYRVTKRSAERTINKLLFGEVIKVVGEEKPYLKGRPRKLFQIVM